MRSILAGDCRSHCYGPLRWTQSRSAICQVFGKKVRPYRLFALKELQLPCKGWLAKRYLIFKPPQPRLGLLMQAGSILLRVQQQAFAVILFGQFVIVVLFVDQAALQCRVTGEKIG